VNGADLLALCKEALARAGEPEAELYARFRDRGAARFASGELGQHMHIEEPSVVARVAHGERVASIATNALSVGALVEAIARASGSAKLVPPTPGFSGFAANDPAPGEAPPRFSESTARATPEERAERLAPVLRRIREAGLVSAGMLETSTTSIAVATTRGCARAHDATMAVFKVWALESAGAGGAAGHGLHAHRDLAALDLESQTERAIVTCERSKDPTELDAGTYDVVLEPSAFAELVEWLGFIAFGAPELEQGTSPLAGRFGQSITGEAVTIEEDPLDATELGFGAPFDREGTWRSKVTLVDRGVARAGLYDRTYAARDKKTPTGSALDGSFDGAASIGPCALHVASGTAASTEELIAGIDRGLYICRLHYVNGYVEPRRAVMTGLSRDGCFWIEDGKIARPVGNMRFTDSLLEGLSRCDGMTRARVAVPTYWSEAGAIVVPAVRIRAFHFDGASQRRPEAALR
jgi:predicted Zn-dependent protease